MDSTPNITIWIITHLKSTQQKLFFIKALLESLNFLKQIVQNIFAVSNAYFTTDFKLRALRFVPVSFVRAEGSA